MVPESGWAVMGKWGFDQYECIPRPSAASIEGRQASKNGRSAWRKPPESLTQRYALVVSIETLDESVDIYDAVRIKEENTDAQD